MSKTASTLIPALTDPVEWDKAGKIHDWRNHIGDHVRAVWDTFSTEQKVAIAADAQERGVQSRNQSHEQHNKRCDQS